MATASINSQWGIAFPEATRLNGSILTMTNTGCRLSKLNQSTSGCAGPAWARAAIGRFRDVLPGFFQKKAGHLMILLCNRERFSTSLQGGKEPCA